MYMGMNYTRCIPNQIKWIYIEFIQNELDWK